MSTTCGSQSPCCKAKKNNPNNEVPVNTTEAKAARRIGNSERGTPPLTVQPNMNSTTNILVHYQLTDLSNRSTTNYFLALVCLAVCAVNIVLLCLNYVMNHGEHEPMVTRRTFHLMEFWTSFVYAVTDAGALATTPKTMGTITSKPLVLKLLLFCNIVASLVPAILITLDTEYFEHVSHELEYINEFTLSCITLVLLTSLLQEPQEQEDFDEEQQKQQQSEANDDVTFASSSYTVDNSSAFTGILSCAVAVTTFTIYNTSREEYAHICEFIFNIATSLITFWFCIDNRFVAEMEIGQILYGQHKNCNLCQTHLKDYQITRRTSIRWMSLYGAQDKATTTEDTTTTKNRSSSRPCAATSTTTTTANVSESSPLLSDPLASLSASLTALAPTT